MSDFALQAKLRKAVGKRKLSGVRSDGFVPAVVYSSGKEAQTLQVRESEFVKVYSRAGDSTLIDLQVDGGMARPVLVHSIDHYPVSGRVRHVDFYSVDMTKKLHTKVALTFVGAAPAIKTHGAMLTHNLNDLEIECLPKDLPSSLAIDVSGMTEVGQLIRVKDVVVPAGVEVLTEPDLVVVLAELPKEEKVEEVAPVEAEAAAIQEVAGEKKEEGEGGEKKEAPEEKKD